MISNNDKFSDFLPTGGTKMCLNTHQEAMRKGTFDRQTDFT